jgi:(p)ppGpp synthase/HD superfamily hydrolase
MLEKAILIATKAHADQIDRSGEPYIMHPIRVMTHCATTFEKICAVLHDVVEDTSITLQDLRDAGFSEDIVHVIDLLSRRDDESYEAFIERICTDIRACRVKRADLRDNMDMSRIKNPTPEDFQRMEKYEAALKRIHDVLYPGEQVLKQTIRFQGRLILPEDISEGSFYNQFMDLVESNHGYFVGLL